MYITSCLYIQNSVFLLDTLHACNGTISLRVVCNVSIYLHHVLVPSVHVVVQCARESCSLSVRSLSVNWVYTPFSSEHQLISPEHICKLYQISEALELEPMVRWMWCCVRGVVQQIQPYSLLLLLVDGVWSVIVWRRCGHDSLWLIYRQWHTLPGSSWY